MTNEERLKRILRKKKMSKKDAVFVKGLSFSDLESLFQYYLSEESRLIGQIRDVMKESGATEAELNFHNLHNINPTLLQIIKLKILKTKTERIRSAGKKCAELGWILSR